MIISPVVAKWYMSYPNFGRSVNHISTKGGKLCTSNFNWYPRKIRSSYGPDYMKVEEIPHKKRGCTKKRMFL